ncbi:MULTISPECIES: DUF4398 domain-containing protein [unclassified Bacillus (in: firmicutes)]|uniref:DUF4398 domain-containing protein n=1 Tax=unclassified Bacillus (in: firmicutes) TaxID=185979 RepID=UPI0008E6633C|nr:MULTISPECIES: DUF4398 domain-containing protein [unclassified Bacillus (in: firmicutes)]SFI03349.1 protein of unknown function [Bacillus sp. 71mf]SFS81042.1 protein of unknown function [Bacillus sp. 103mf]
MKKRILTIGCLFIMLAGCGTSNYGAHVEAGMKALKDEKYSDAIMWFEKADQEKSTDETKTFMKVAKWMEHGATALKDGDYKQAMEDSNQVINIKKDTTLEKAVKSNAEDMLQKAKDIENKEITREEKRKKIEEKGIDKAIKAVDSVDEIREKQKEIGESLDKAEKVKEKIEAKKN